MSSGPAGPSLPPLPPFRSLVVKETSSGFTVAPRGPAADLWIEAVVWVVASASLGLCLVFGGTVLRVIGGVALVAIAVRAARRVVSAAFGGTTRILRVLLRVPRPSLAGMLEFAALDDLTGLDIAQRQGLTGLVANTSSGAEHWLVDLDPANADDYIALIAWVERLCGRRLRSRLGGEGGR